MVEHEPPSSDWQRLPRWARSVLKNQTRSVRQEGNGSMAIPARSAILTDPWFVRELQAIDGVIASTPPARVPALFSRIPLDVFGLLLLERPDRFPHLRAWLPAMPADDVQIAWVGSAGVPLMTQSLRFISG